MTNLPKRENPPIQCFLIDDDIDDQEIFSLALEEVDEVIQCVFADDGVKALERLNNDYSFLPNYIFIDINMPRMSGIECLEKIRKLPHLKHIPLFMFSTSAEAHLIAKAKELGASDFIVKPPSIVLLSKLLTQLFNLNEHSINEGQ